MNRDDVAKIVKKRFAELGIPDHVTKVTKVPSKVEALVIIGEEAVKLNLRSGITAQELEEKLDHLRHKWSQRMPRDQGRQVDLEEVIEEKSVRA